MTYEPKPLDTQGVDLQHLQGVTEFLAEQVHEAWAAKRVAEGWSHGPARDDVKKQTPNLVPYDQLSEEDKDYDRRVSSHTLALLLQRGYRIVAPGAETLFGLQAALTESVEDDFTPDLPDSPEIPAPLRERLTAINEIIAEDFKQWDGAASDCQRTYLRASLRCTLCVMSAIALALYQVAGYPTPGLHYLVIPIVELLLVVNASRYVLHDYRHQWKDNWLLNRARTERVRALKYHALLDPELWSAATLPQVTAKLRQEVVELRLAGPHNLATWLERPSVIPVRSFLSGDLSLDQAICNYYWRRRVIAQLKHASKKAMSHEHEDNRTKVYGTVLFFAVLAFVFSHLLVDMVCHEQLEAKVPFPSFLSKLLAVLAALVPAIGAALHVYRSGREWGRNHLRMKALGLKLNLFRTELERPATLSQHLFTIHQCENTLLAEQQQWLQLMKECEWYG
jgi:hypothetical protein